MARWTSAQIPDQTGRTVVVTGANAGLGFQTVLALARKGARVIATSRSDERAQAALAALRRELPDADVEFARLDLADLESVRNFARGVLDRDGGLDVLVNNAGVFAVPSRRTTAQGFELQFGTNHLGHFALTGLLLPKLGKTNGSRVVTVTSINHRLSNGLDFDDLQHERRYSGMVAYNDSKLANTLFTLELDRRLRAAQRPMISVAAHPGVAVTNLHSAGPSLDGATFKSRAVVLLTRVFGQSSERGALPQLCAATMPDVQPGEFIGSTGFWEMRGAPGRVEFSRAALDPATAERLWAESERLAGVRFEIGHLPNSP